MIALDVGYGQLHPRLRDDPRVTVLERVNARHLAELPFLTGACHVRRVVHLGDARAAAGDRARRARLGSSRPRQAPVRGRPRRGAGRRARPRGAPSRLRGVLRGGRRVACARRGRRRLRHPGPKGNREFVVHLIASEEPSDPDELERRIEAAVRVAARPSHARRSSRTGAPSRSATGSSASWRSQRSGVELLVGPDEAARHGLTPHGERPRPTSSSCSAVTGRCFVPCRGSSTRACP